MEARINACCTSCGATFPREEATTECENKLSCPSCGCGVVRAIPGQRTALARRESARCGACGATFPRSEAQTETKGRLVCPICGENDVRTNDESA